MPDINLDAPEQLHATAENAKDFTFYIVKSDAKYTKEAFEQNPNVATGEDLFLKSDPLPDTGQGFVSFDLKPKAQELKDKVKEPRTAVKVVVLSTAKPECADADKKQAVVKDFTLVKPIDLKLTALRARVNAGQWVGYHTAVCFMEIELIGEHKRLVLEVDPKAEPVPMMVGVWEPKAKGQISAKRYLEGGFGDTFGRSGLDGEFPGLGSWGALWGKGAAAGKFEMAVPGDVKLLQVGLYPRSTGTFTLSVTSPDHKMNKKESFGFDGAHPHP